VSPVEGQKVVIIGLGETAEMAYGYFSRDSPHTVVGFSADDRFVAESSLCGVPVVPLSGLVAEFPPTTFSAFVAVSSTQLNRVRARLYAHVKELGYACVSYVSSRAFVWDDVAVGDNAFILENNVLQHRVRIGDNVVLWSGNHVGHQTVVHDHCFVSSHVVISGFCTIGRSCFLGVNCCFADGITVGEDAVVGMGAVVVRDLAARGVYLGNPARASGRDSFDAFAVVES
jgi:sugar O-acyltransferase (sialic acid O-acetyltransferase NeuD family)